MDVDLREDVYALLAEGRVNIELMFTWSDESGSLITCRLRPWKNSEEDGNMILAGGRTADEALYWAGRALLNKQWINLDWRARANGIGVTTILAPIVSEQQAQRTRRLLSKELWEPIPVPQVPHTPNNVTEGNVEAPVTNTRKLGRGSH